MTAALQAALLRHGVGTRRAPVAELFVAMTLTLSCFSGSSSYLWLMRTVEPPGNPVSRFQQAKCANAIGRKSSMIFLVPALSRHGVLPCVLMLAQAIESG